MPEWVEVTTQEELDRALARSDAVPVCVGDGRFAISGSGTLKALDKATVEASGAATVEAWDLATVEAREQATVAAWSMTTISARDQTTVEAAGSARVRASGRAVVRAWDLTTVWAGDSTHVTALGRSTVWAEDSAKVRAANSATVVAVSEAGVTAWGSATVRARDSVQVKAWDSATVIASGSVRVEATDSANVSASQTSSVEASGLVAVVVGDTASVDATEHVRVTRYGGGATIHGGTVVQAPEITSAADWCSFYAVEVENGIATLYKAVDSEFKSPHGVSYMPGSQPEAPDWDGGSDGGGLYFSPKPFLGLKFMPNATRFVACPVRLTDIVVQGHQPKAMARSVAGPVYEVDEDGAPLG